MTFAQHHRQRARALLGALFFISAPAFADGVPAKPAAEIFSRRCAGCHGDDGSGPKMQRKGAPIPSLRTPEWQRAHTEPQIAQIIADGVPGKHMPSFKNRLNKDEIAALASLVHGLAGTSDR